MGFCSDLEGGGVVGVVGATESQHQRRRQQQHYGIYAWPRDESEASSQTAAHGGCFDQALMDPESRTLTPLTLTHGGTNSFLLV